MAETINVPPQTIEKLIDRTLDMSIQDFEMKIIDKGATIEHPVVLPRVADPVAKMNGKVVAVWCD